MCLFHLAWETWWSWQSSSILTLLITAHCWSFVCFSDKCWPVFLSHIHVVSKKFMIIWRNYCLHWLKPVNIISVVGICMQSLCNTHNEHCVFGVFTVISAVHHVWCASSNHLFLFSCEWSMFRLLFVMWRVCPVLLYVGAIESVKLETGCMLFV